MILDDLGIMGGLALAVVALSAMDHMDELPKGLRIDRY